MDDGLSREMGMLGEVGCSGDATQVQGDVAPAQAETQRKCREMWHLRRQRQGVGEN